MFIVADVLAAFKNICGYRDNEDTTGVQLTTTTAGTTLTTTTSGLYYNDEHPLLDTENIAAASKDWAALYAATGDQNTALSDWIEQKTNAGIIKALNDWFSQKSEFQTFRNLLDDDILLNTSGNINDEITKVSGRRVGIEIRKVKSNNLVGKIKQFSLRLTAANPSLEIKLWSSDQEAALFTETVNYTTANKVQWFTPAADWTLSPNKTYWITYNEDELTGSAINEVYDMGFGGRSYQYFPNEYIMFSAFSDTQGGSTLWDLEQNSYTVDSNYGINLKFDVRCDLTTLIIDQKNLFRSLVSKSVAMTILRHMAFNPDALVNRTVDNPNAQRRAILLEIDGDSEGDFRNNGMLAMQYKREMMKIQFDYAGIDDICMPCRKTGVNFQAGM